MNILKIQDGVRPPFYKCFLAIIHSHLLDFSEILRGGAVFHRISAKEQIPRVPQNVFIGERYYVTFALWHEPSVCRLLSVTFVRPAHKVKLFVSFCYIHYVLYYMFCTT